MFHQSTDVASSFAERRYREGKHIQTVIQILTEIVPCRVSPQVMVGGGDDPDIHRLRGLAADAGDLTGLQDPQQGRLEIQRHVSDLIEEDRTAVGQLEFARLPVPGRPRKSIAFVSEKFALD